MKENLVLDFSANEWKLRIGEHEYMVVGEFPMPASPELLDQPLIFRVNVNIDNEEAFTAFTDGMNKDTKQFEFHTIISALFGGGYRRLKATYRGCLVSATASGAVNGSADLTYNVAISPEGDPKDVWTKKITERIQGDEEQPPYKTLWEFDGIH